MKPLPTRVALGVALATAALGVAAPGVAAAAEQPDLAPATTTSAAVPAPADVATPAPAPVAAPTGVSATVSVRPKAYEHTERAVLAVHVLNTDTASASIRIITPYGEKKVDGVAPGKAAYLEVDTGLGTIPAGQVTVAAYVPASAGSPARYQQRTATYAGITATLAPRGSANAASYRHPQDGGVVLTASFTNTGAHAVSVRYKTPYGDSAAQTVQPGARAYLTVRTGRASVPAGAAVVAAYKWVEGKGYYTELPVTTPATTDAPPVVVITSPAVGSEHADGLTVTGTATDDVRLAGTVTAHLRALQANGKCGAFVQSVVVPVAADGTWTATFDTAGLVGEHCVTALAKDAFGTENVGGGTHLKTVTLGAPAAVVAPVEEAPAAGTPVEETVAEEPPVEEAPAEEAPVEETVAEEPPAEEAPAAELVVDEAPVEEAPVEVPAPLDPVAPSTDGQTPAPAPAAPTEDLGTVVLASSPVVPGAATPAATSGAVLTPAQAARAVTPTRAATAPAVPTLARTGADGVGAAGAAAVLVAAGAALVARRTTVARRHAR